MKQRLHPATTTRRARTYVRPRFIDVRLHLSVWHRKETHRSVRAQNRPSLLPSFCASDNVAGESQHAVSYQPGTHRRNYIAAKWQPVATPPQLHRRSSGGGIGFDASAAAVLEELLRVELGVLLEAGRHDGHAQLLAGGKTVGSVRLVRARHHRLRTDG